MSRNGKNKDIYCISPHKNQLSSTLEVKRPQISQQFLLYDNHHDQLKTARPSLNQYELKSSSASAKNQPPSQENGNDLEAHLIQLTNQINNQRETIAKISHIIDYLTDKNQQLSYRYVEAIQQLQKVENFYSQKLQVANNLIKQLEEKCTRSDTPGLQSRSTHGKITPVKICSKNPDESYCVSFNEFEKSVLKDIGRLILSQKIYNFENQLNKLQQFANSESEQIQTAIEQHKYLQAFIEDEVLGISDSTVQNRQKTPDRTMPSVSVQELLDMYKSQIVGWQNYANILKRNLSDCINFIDKFITTKDIKVQNKKRLYTNSDLVKYITQQICRNFKKTHKQNKEQISQMRDLLKDAFAQLKKYEQKQADPVQIQQA